MILLLICVLLARNIFQHLGLSSVITRSYETQTNKYNVTIVEYGIKRLPAHFPEQNRRVGCCQMSAVNYTGLLQPFVASV